MADQIGGLLSPWLRRRRIAAVRAQLRGRVLDVGCGVGALAEFVAAERYLGVDADRESIDEARRRFPDHRFEAIPRNADWVENLDGERFDSVVLLAVIEHLSEPATLLAALTGRLARGGHLVLTTPAPALEWAHDAGARIGLFSAEANEEHETLIDPPRMREIAARAGLQVVEQRRFLVGANQCFTLSPSPRDPVKNC